MDDLTAKLAHAEEKLKEKEAILKQVIVQCRTLKMELAMKKQIDICRRLEAEAIARIAQVRFID